MKTGRRNSCEPAALVFLKCEIHVAVKRLYHPRATLDCSRKMCPKVFKSLTLVELGRILLLPSLYKAQPCIQWLIVLGNSYCGYGLSNLNSQSLRVPRQTLEKYEKGSGFFSVYPIARFVLMNVSSTNVFDSGQDRLSTDWWRQVPSQWKVGAKGSPAVCSLCQLWEPGPRQLWAGLGTLNRTGGSRLVPGNSWALLFKQPREPVLSKAQDPRLPRKQLSKVPGLVFRKSNNRSSVQLKGS